MADSRGEGGWSLPDVLLGVLGGAMVIFALVAVVMGRGASDVPVVTPPAVTILTPVEGEVLQGRLEIVFETDEEIFPSPSGWGTGELHLHLSVDGQEIMAAPEAIVLLQPRRYRWVVPGVTAGDHELRFFWADSTHQRLEGGESETIDVTVL